TADGLEALLLRELDPRSDLDLLGVVLGHIADRIGRAPGALVARETEILRDVSRALRAAEPSARPDLQGVAATLGQVAGRALVLPVLGPFLHRAALTGREQLLHE